jgi:uncharacterized radical SAM protein YgiQ
MRAGSSSPWADRLLVVNPPFPTMTEEQIDSSFDLPYTRLPHPRYRKRGPIPAYEMIKHSINMHRGCFGGCSFCTISAHQGKFVASRSKESILREVRGDEAMPDFRGTITDLGGPSANMYRMRGREQWICDECERPSCIWPDVCRNLDTDHAPLLEIYKAVRETEGVKHAFVTSGIRYDLFLHEKRQPEARPATTATSRNSSSTTCPAGSRSRPSTPRTQVLKVMRKPSFGYFRRFKEKFDAPQRPGAASRSCSSSRTSSARIRARGRRTWPTSRSARPRSSASSWSRCRTSRPRR